MKLNPIKKTSAWQFVTSSTGGIGVEFFAAEGGQIYLNDPSGSLRTFTYGVAGGGLSIGFKLPKIGKLQIPVKGASVGGVGAPASFPNTGCLYILSSFDGDELTYNDISGVCGLVEIGGGLIAGASSTAMLLGMNPKWMAATVVAMASPLSQSLMPLAYKKLIESATSLLLMAGVNAGVQGGAGIIGCTGYLG
ncbi:MAG: hypothetical protein WCK96_01000 [Methylococcales bacterium]